MYKDERVKNHSENIFFVAYLLFESLKAPKDREFGPYTDLFPDTCRQFPFTFDEQDMRSLDGSPI